MMTGAVRCCVVVGLSAGCISPVMRFGGGKSAKEAQYQAMSELAPVQLETEAKWAGEITTRKIRVWADDQYRAQNVRWQQSFEGPLELTNLVLTSLFGLRLVPEFHAWDRHVAGSTIGADLEALAERDPGHDVGLVVGLTSALPLVSTAFDELGAAEVGGRHLIVRGYADLEERERSREAWRHHKTAVVLLHEIGHAFGAGHDIGEDTIMSASYSHRADAFSPQAREVMLRSIERRLGRASSTGTWREPPVAPGPPPRASGSTSPLVLHLTPSGDLELDGKALDQYDVDYRLEDAAAQDPNAEVIIRRSREAPRAALVKIVERAMAIGLTVSVAPY